MLIIEESMKTFLIIISGLFSCLAIGQENLWDLDTTTDYTSRFYSEGKLTLSEHVIFYDSIVIDGEKVQTAFKTDYQVVKSGMNSIVYENLEMIKEGFWKEKLNKRGEPTEKKRFKTYRLLEYQNRLIMGKMYEFDKKDRLIKMSIAYPTISDTVLNGLQIVKYDQEGMIEEIEFTLFNVSIWDFISELEFYPNGAIEYWSIGDYSGMNQTSERYFENGDCRYYEISMEHSSYSVNYTFEEVQTSYTYRDDEFQFSEEWIDDKLTHYSKDKLRKHRYPRK